MEGKAIRGTLLCEHAPGHTAGEEAIKNLRNDPFHLSGKEGGGIMLDDSPPPLSPTIPIQIAACGTAFCTNANNRQSTNNEPKPEEWQ